MSQFVNPGYLWALLLGLIPIIIYYLMRFRSLRVTWGANYVLERALERLRKKLYWDQIILLILRILACLAIVLAFARPLSRRQGATGDPHYLLIVDSSYSMLAGPEGQSRWDQARDLMKRLTATWGRTSAWSILQVGETLDWTLESAGVQTPEKSAAQIEALTIGESAADLAKAVKEAADRMGKLEPRVFIFADDQASTWSNMARIERPFGDDASLVWVNPPLRRRENLAVTAVRVGGERALVRHPIRIFVAVRNFGREPVRDVPVKVLADGVFVKKERISLLPGQEGWLHVDLSFGKAGSHTVGAQLAADALEFDNRASAALEVVEQLRLVVLRDPAKTGKFDSAWEFLNVLGRTQEMVDDDEMPVFTSGPLAVSLVEGSPTAEKLAAADVVVLDGGQPLTPELADLLRDYVRSGGSLVLAADEGVDRGQWNELLGKADLLPARLGRRHVEPLGSDKFQSLGRNDFASPELRAFETAEDGDLGKAKFYHWHEFEDLHQSASVLATFTTREPFAVTRRFRPGAVTLLATGLSGGSNNLIVREFFPALAYRLFSGTAAGSLYPRTIGRGEGIGLRLPPGKSVEAATFSFAGGEPVALTPTKLGAGQQLVVPGGSPVSGLSSILLAADPEPTRVWYGVQGERVDSDLSALSPARQANILERAGIIEVNDWAALSEIVEGSRTGNELQHLVLAALMLILFGEMLMQLRFI